jgi:hypothetical protein
MEPERAIERRNTSMIRVYESLAQMVLTDMTPKTVVSTCYLVPHDSLVESTGNIRLVWYYSFMSSLSKTSPPGHGVLIAAY